MPSKNRTSHERRAPDLQKQRRVHPAVATTPGEGEDNRDGGTPQAPRMRQCTGTRWSMGFMWNEWDDSSSFAARLVLRPSPSTTQPPSVPGVLIAGNHCCTERRSIKQIPPCLSGPSREQRTSSSPAWIATMAPPGSAPPRPNHQHRLEAHASSSGSTPAASTAASSRRPNAQKHPSGMTPQRSSSRYEPSKRCGGRVGYRQSGPTARREGPWVPTSHPGETGPE